MCSRLELVAPFSRDLLSQPLWSCQNQSLNQKATLSRGCDSRSPKATATDESDKLESGAHTCSGCATSCAGVKRLHQRNQRFYLMRPKKLQKPNAKPTVHVISGFFQIKPEMMIILLFPNTAKALAKTCTHTQKKEKLFSSQDTRSTQPAENHTKCRYRTLCGIIRRRVVRHRTVSCGTVLHRALILSDQRIREHLAFCLA